MAVGRSYEQAQSTDPPVLASISGMVVTEDHFLNAFREAYLRTGQVLTPDIATRRAVLESEFNTYVLAVHAKELGIEDEPEAIRQFQAIRRRVITEEYKNQVILKGLAVSELELREHYLRFNTRLRASHLFSPTLDGIRELADRLAAGESFDALAAETFRNRILASNGGDLGWFTTDEMDVAFEEAAFRLAVGETSAPVRTAQGYSIIRLTDRSIVPLLTEQDFLRQKPRLESYVLKRKRELRTREHMDEFMAGLKMESDVMADLWSAVGGDVSSFLELNAEGRPSNTGREHVLIRFGDFRFTVEDWLLEAGSTPASMLSGIRDRASFDNLAKGLAYRAYMMKEADTYGIPGQTLVLESIDETYRHHLAQEVMNRLEASIDHSDEELIAEFDRDPSRYAIPVSLELQRIILKDEETARNVHASALSGEDFGNLVRRHTINGEERLLDGLLGMQSVTSFGFNGPLLGALEVGGISDVITFTQGEYHIYKCLGREEARQLPFEEAYGMVEDILTRKKLQVLRRQTIERTMIAHGAFIDEKRLNELVIQIR